jgi:hypothetical protein
MVRCLRAAELVYIKLAAVSGWPELATPSPPKVDFSPGLRIIGKVALFIHLN